MEGLLGIFTAFGLSSSAGLNAYMPLLVVALLARFTDLVTLNPPWNALESWWTIGVLTVLLLIEVVVDKVPAVDSINDVIQTLIRPAAGAVLFAASAGVISDVHPVLALVCGLLVAGGVHAVKATARPLVTGASGGVLNPVVSVIEDILLLLVIIWFVRRRRRRAERAAAWW